ncbi:amidohydrolase family protein [Streptomyces sp. NPDC056909]|uniref:N-acyl-D-amino-acid deacylase family protein n=1 Tax=Streptomyces sp. NPDC056909 TaxID=3345963 RepID=UPI0036C6C819
MTSLLIRGSRLFDGTGTAERPADVLLVEGVIAAVAAPGTLSRVAADRVVDADGLALAPGFIDAHSHADSVPFLPGIDASKISQGVTTEVVGNCGFSLAPHPADRSSEIQEMCGRLFPSLPYDWSTTAELYERTDQAGYTVNTVPLVGHHTLRAAVMGIDDRAPYPAETAEMSAHLRAAISAGAFGLSSGLIYAPGVFATVDELAALAAGLPAGGVYATHLRGEGPRLLDGVAEAIAVAERVGCRLQVSHLKAAGKDAWGSVVPAMELMDLAWKRGVDVHHDVYPYEANSTMLMSCLPPWFQDGGHEATVRRLRDPSALARAEGELARDDGTWENWVGGSGWPNVMIASTANHEFEGLTLDRVAELRGTTPFQALVDVLVANDLRATMSVFAMCEEDVEAVLRHPRALVGSDGLPPGQGGKPHPRLYGTFTRVLARHVREKHTLSLPEAIAKMTSRTAKVFGIEERGVVRPGAAADVVLFDPDRVQDKATFLEPTRVSEGIEMVLVGGVVGWERGEATGVRGGRRLRPGAEPVGTGGRTAAGG